MESGGKPILQGKGGLEFEGVGGPYISPDGKVVAYVGHRGKRRYFLVNGKIVGKFSRIENVRFGPDGKTPAFRASKYGKEMVVVGNTVGEEFDQVLSGPVWSRDGKQVAFVVREGSGEVRSKVMDAK